MSRSRSRSPPVHDYELEPWMVPPRSRSRSPPPPVHDYELESWMKPPSTTNQWKHIPIDDNVTNELSSSPKPSCIGEGDESSGAIARHSIFDGMGDGGCLAVALSSLGILGDSFDDVCKELDSCIDPVHRRLMAQDESRGRPACKRELAGIERTKWNPYTVKEAMIKKYGMGKFLFKKHPVNGKWYKTPGCYIVDGFLNRTYVKVGPRGGLQKIHHDNWKKNDSRNDWRHCIAVKISSDSSQFYCRHFGHWVPINDYLWLDVNGRPDPTMGYMEDICKVYEVKGLLPPPCVL
jgi:hypothetical protein